jgi:hypothetical protein
MGRCGLNWSGSGYGQVESVCEVGTLGFHRLLGYYRVASSCSAQLRRLARSSAKN